jgi:predicted metal-dependent hydrolase
MTIGNAVTMRKKAKTSPASPLVSGAQVTYTCWHDADEMRWAARQWAARIGVKLRAVHLRSMSSKWASISTAGRLTLDSSLLETPRELGEYVIVHELVHLLCPKAQHGRVFKSFMFAYLPDWEERHARLSESLIPRSDLP